MNGPPKLTDEEIDYIVNHNTEFVSEDLKNGTVYHCARQIVYSENFAGVTNYNRMISVKSEDFEYVVEDEEGYADGLCLGGSVFSFKPMTERHLTEFVKTGRLPYVTDRPDRESEDEPALSQDSETVPLHS